MLLQKTLTLFFSLSAKDGEEKRILDTPFKKACERHEERVKAFTEIFQKSKTIKGIKGIIVTLLDAFAEEGEILLVPVCKLNWFLLNYHTFI